MQRIHIGQISTPSQVFIKADTYGREGWSECNFNSPVTGEFPAQKASNAENVSISWRHHVIGCGHNVTDGEVVWDTKHKITCLVKNSDQVYILVVY